MKMPRILKLSIRTAGFQNRGGLSRRSGSTVRTCAAESTRCGLGSPRSGGVTRTFGDNFAITVANLAVFLRSYPKAVGFVVCPDAVPSLTRQCEGRSVQFGTLSDLVKRLGTSPEGR